MRVLILSGNTGEGHNSAAKAIKDCFEKMGDTCEIKDALAFWSDATSSLISNGHIFIYKNAPKLFGVVYRFMEKHPAQPDGRQSFMYDIVTHASKGLYNYLKTEHYDAIVSTHVFAGMILTKIEKKYGLGVKSYFIATDYTCSPGVNELIVDKYFIPHKALTDEFVSCGIKREKIVPSGIPVRASFYRSEETQRAKETLGLPVDKKTVLLMSGSMGCGPIKALSERLQTEMPDDSHLVVICGNNKKLYKTIRYLDGFSNVSIVGYTDKMPLYMDAADLALTKPGGLSSTEAFVKNLPLILINAVPGCETRNLDFFLKYDLTETADSVNELSNLVCNYLRDDEKINGRREIIEQSFSENAAEIICKEIKG